LWNDRLGHLIFRKLQEMKAINMVRGLKKHLVSERFCEICVLWKHHQDPFPLGKSWRARPTLQLIQNVLCGPISHPSVLGIP